MSEVSRVDEPAPLLSLPTEMLQATLKILITWRDIRASGGPRTYYVPRSTEELAKDEEFLIEQEKLIPLIEEELKLRDSANQV